MLSRKEAKKTEPRGPGLAPSGPAEARSHRKAASTELGDRPRADAPAHAVTAPHPSSSPGAEVKRAEARTIHRGAELEGRGSSADGSHLVGRWVGHRRTDRAGFCKRLAREPGAAAIWWPGAQDEVVPLDELYPVPAPRSGDPGALVGKLVRATTESFQGEVQALVVKDGRLAVLVGGGRIFALDAVVPVEDERQPPDLGEAQKTRGTKGTKEMAGGTRGPRSLEARPFVGGKVQVGFTGRVYGPLKLGAEGTLQYMAKGDEGIELEGQLEGTVSLDLVFVRFNAKYGGKVKITSKDNSANPFKVAEDGVRDILRHAANRRLIGQAQQVRAGLVQGYEAGREAWAAARTRHFHASRNAHAERWLSVDAANPGTNGKAYDAASAAMDKHLARAFGALDVSAPERLGIPARDREAMIQAFWDSGSYPAQTRLILTGPATRTIAAFEKRRAEAQTIFDERLASIAQNDPAVGFEHELGWKIGAEANLAKRVGASIEYSSVEKVSDELGEQSYANTKVDRVKGLAFEVVLDKVHKVKAEVMTSESGELELKLSGEVTANASPEMLDANLRSAFKDAKALIGPHRGEPKKALDTLARHLDQAWRANIDPAGPSNAMRRLIGFELSFKSTPSKKDAPWEIGCKVWDIRRAQHEGAGRGVAKALAESHVGVVSKAILP